MFDAEKLAALTDAELKSLDANVKRLGVSGSTAQKTEAERLTPMIEHEQSVRRANKPPPATRERKVATKKKTAKSEA